MTVDLPDGLYRVDSELYKLCAGFVVEAGRVTMCAPVLRKRFLYWLTLARRIG